MTFKRVRENAGLLETGKKTLHLVRDCFTVTEMAKQHGDFYIRSKRSKSDYLSVSGQFVYLANSVGSLFNGKRFRW